MSPTLRHRRAWLVLGWLMVAAAVTVSLLPSERLPSIAGVNDKVEHSVTYTVLALWFAGVYPRSRYLAIAAGLFLMGVAIEWAQGAMNLGRQSDFHDVIANSSGIALGLALALAGLGRWAQRLEGLVHRP